MSLPEKMDQMSRLPEELLRHVLSFLPTKEAGLTSVLSKRWRNLVTFVPNLEIDDSFFLDPEESMPERKRILQGYMDYADRISALQGDSRIVKFSLKWRSGVDPDRANQWIRNVLRFGVFNMDLFIPLERYQLPSDIFMSETLVKMKIGALELPFDLRRVPHVSLPMLKTLVLESVLFLSGQLQMLLSACSALEELDMTNASLCYGNETVSSASLKTLTFKYLRAFSFDTPDLVCLKLSVGVAYDYPLVNSENLVEAHIEILLDYPTIKKFQRPRKDWLRDDGFLGVATVHKLVRDIRNVQKLYLSPGSLQVLALCCQEMPVFNKLTFLYIESSMDTTWQAMPILLRSCRHLETLVIKGLSHHVTDECRDSCICVSREDKGRSLMSCPVKRLEIRGVEGTAGELEMIKHFLGYFPCLKEMEIYITDGRPQFQLQELNPEILMRYNDLSGHSPNVKVKVHRSLPRTSQ